MTKVPFDTETLPILQREHAIVDHEAEVSFLSELEVQANVQPLSQDSASEEWGEEIPEYLIRAWVDVESTDWRPQVADHQDNDRASDILVWENADGKFWKLGVMKEYVNCLPHFYLEAGRVDPEKTAGIPSEYTG